MASALERVRANTFETRDASTDPPPVSVGCFVKVGIRGERFWCEVKSMSGDGRLNATVDNDLLRTDWRRGHTLALQREHVLESADVRDRLTFHRLAALTGSRRGAALVWRDMRAMQGVSPRPEPAWLVVPEIDRLNAA